MGGDKQYEPGESLTPEEKDAILQAWTYSANCSLLIHVRSH